MKFLIALSILASATAFAQENRRAIFCYESARQGGHGEVAYFLEERGEGNQVLHVVYPYELSGPLKLDEESGCLEHPGGGSGTTTVQPDRLRLCPAQGQRINDLVPVEASVGRDEETVYCDKRIKRWFEADFNFLN